LLSKPAHHFRHPGSCSWCRAADDIPGGTALARGRTDHCGADKELDKHGNISAADTGCLLFIHFILLQQSEAVAIHTELDSKATKHRQLPMS